MNHLYLLAFVAITAASANVLRPLHNPCIPLPECPLKNNDTYTLHVAHKNDCTKFYKCDNGCGYLMECPYAEGETERLMFHVDLQICDWAVNVPKRECLENIGVEESLSSDLEESSSPQPESFSLNQNDFLKECPAVGKQYIPHEKDCHNYYECENGEKTLHRCNENLIFNPYVEACDYTTSVDCITTGHS